MTRELSDISPGPVLYAGLIFRLRRWRLVKALALMVLVGVTSSFALAQDLGEHFASPVTRVDAGRTAVLTFSTAERATVDMTLASVTTDANVVGIIQSGAILAGKADGYVRIKGVGPGRATVRVGSASIDVEVVPPRSPEWRRPRIEVAGPAHGACVWGELAVGVRVPVEPGEEEPVLELVLPSGKTLSPVAVSSENLGPVRHARFSVDFGSEAAGPAELLFVRRDREGAEIARTTTTVRVVDVTKQPVVTFEAEDQHAVTKPKRFEGQGTSVQRDAEASGLRYWSNAGSYPVVCLPIKVEAEGVYQVVARARGAFGGGAMPTIGLVVDGSYEAATTAPVLSGAWHRVAIGVPVRLEAGDRVLSPYFENDFYVPNVADRNLDLDVIEVARVGDASGPASPAGDAMTGMMAQGLQGGMMGGQRPGGRARANDGLDDPRGLAIAFDRVLDGATVSGGLEVRGRAWWPRREATPPPTVTLEVNGEALGDQRSGAPRFWVDPSWFKPGDNTIRMVAQRDDGSWSATPAQRVTWSSDVAPASLEGRIVEHRFPAVDPRWSEGVSLSNDKWPAEGRAAVFMSNGSAKLDLPLGLAGQFEVVLELLGTDFQGPCRASVMLDAPGASEIGQVDAPTWWDQRLVGRVKLSTGPKSLRVAFVNDKYEKDVGDRNLHLHAVVLRTVSTRPDASAPASRILHPRAGEAVFMQDAIVADVGDDQGVARVEALVDGVPTGVVREPRGRSGRVVLPLLARGLPKGSHRVAVRVTDVSGNVAESNPVEVSIAESAPADLTRYERAVVMLDRFGFGPSAADLGDVLAVGEHEWLALQLRGDGGSWDHPGDRDAMTLASTWFPTGRNEYEVPRRVLAHAMGTPRPARARLVLWVNNHFSTWIRKAEADRKWEEFASFTRLGAAPFADLLAASSRSPAMLQYLDQARSFRGALNENYAREILELHTLGVDAGYTQADVTNLAHVLTGWTSVTEGRCGEPGPARAAEFRFVPSLCDGEARDVLGMRLSAGEGSALYDRALVALEMIASHPRTADYVCTKLVEHYVGVPAHPELVREMAGVFHSTGGDLGEVVMALAARPELYSREAPRRLAKPLDFVVRMYRVTDERNPWLAGDFLQRGGHGLFDRATPDGYPEADEEYSDTNAMLQRWRLAQDMAHAAANGVPPAWRWPPAAPDAAGAQRIVDAIAVRLTGRVLGAESNAAALDVFATVSGNVNERTIATAGFIGQLPEASMR